MLTASNRFSMLGTLIGGVCLLLIGVSLHAVMVHGRTEEAMHRLMIGKGGAILSSLESSLRLSRRNNIMPRQDFLLEEISGIGDVSFAAIAGPDGFVLAHSDLDRLGHVLRFEDRDMTPPDMERLAPDKDARWLLAAMEDKEVFVLYKRIGQALIYSGSTSRGIDGMSAGYNIPLTLFVGLDPAPLLLARAEDSQRTRLFTAVAGLCALLMIVALHWSNKARLSRQSQKTAEALTEKMVLSLPDGLLLFDAQGRISHINMLACQWLRRDKPPLGQRAQDALPPELAALAERLLTGPFLPDSELDLPFGDVTIPLSVRGGPVETPEEGRIGFLLLLRDLSERKLLEEEIRRREKLAAMANLAAGVAHEIRNPLSSIKGYATYFGQRFAEDSDDREAARVMAGEVERLNRVITDLIELARPASLTPRPTDLKALVEDTLRLIRQDAGKRHVAVHLDAVPLPPLHLDPDRIRQALLNLCLNALDAMPQGGTLTLTLKEVQSHAVLDTHDTGLGIAPDVLPHIFDPYFTTKGHGTGLGLATVHKIVEAHGGQILVTSTPGKGSIFRVFLPL